MLSRTVSFNELSLNDKKTWRSYVGAQSFPSPLNDPDYFSFLRKSGQKIDILIGLEGDEPVVFIPFQPRSDSGVEPVALEVSDCSQVISKPNYSFDPVALLKSAGVRYYSFDHLFDQSGFDPEKYSYYQDDCYLIRLQAGYEAYVQDLNANSSSLISQSNRKRRKLDREVGTVRFEYREPDLGLIEKMLAWKVEQLNHQGFQHCFDQAWVQTFMESQLTMKSNSAKGLFSVLYAGRDIAAMHFGTIGYQTINSWIPVVNPQHAKYSPAVILYLELARKADEDGVENIILGRGENQTKRRIANASAPNYVGMISHGLIRSSKFFAMRSLYRFFRSRWGKGIHSSLRNLRQKLKRN